MIRKESSEIMLPLNFEKIMSTKTPKGEALDALAALFAKTNDAKLQRLENKQLSMSQLDNMLSQYYHLWVKARV